MDGDSIESIKHKSLPDKSVDFIIIHKKEFKNNSYNVILYELTKGRNKSVKEIREKFENSSIEINKIFIKFGLNIKNLKCIFLGPGIKNINRCYTELKTSLNLKEVMVDGMHPKDIYIQVEKCGFNINDLNLN